MKFASFDLEIAKELPDDFDSWEEYSPLGITCAAVALSDIDEILFWKGIPKLSKLEAQNLVIELIKIVERGYTLLTWNGASFDFHVLAQESGMFAECGKLALEHIDMMMYVTFQKGWFLSLQKALEGAGLYGKLKKVELNDGTILEDMSGSKAPLLWSKGEYNAVLEYLKEDVLQPLQLINKIQKTKKISWISNKGNPQFVSIDRIINVKECFDYPVPDTSWMDNPPSRVNFVKWIPDYENAINEKNVLARIQSVTNDNKLKEQSKESDFLKTDIKEIVNDNFISKIKHFFSIFFVRKHKDILWNGLNRKHHYLFVHEFFKEGFFKNPSHYSFKAIKSSYDNPLTYLIEVWELSGKLFCNENEIINSKGLNIDFFNIDEYSEICILTLPEPKYMTESYFIALTLKFNPNNKNELLNFYYYTLEKTIGNKPVVCYWDKNGKHGNFDIYIEPQKERFLNVITKLNKK